MLWAVVLVAISVCVSLLTAITRAYASSLMVLIGFGIAALPWVPARRRSLIACQTTVLLRADGWRADFDSLRYGMVIGRECLVACWASMAALMLLSIASSP
ncbi:DUF2182 domain-containing protein [Paraburkholderia sp. LEh10]|jgi:predicted metal-binding membrane protein|nr:DUF2182 domain-containing protein [Paraburkholderia sp. LEh10]